MKHFGNIVRSDLKEIDDITRKTGDFIGHVNKVLAEFHKAPDKVISEFFNSKSAHLYACEAWYQHIPCVDKFYTSWNKGVRRLYYLPSTTHTRFLLEFVNRPYVKSEVLSQFYKLFKTMLISGNNNAFFLRRLWWAILEASLEKILD